MELENHVNSYLAGLESSLPSYQLVESPDCVRNTLGGQKACACIYIVGGQPAAEAVETAPVAGQSPQTPSSSSQTAVMELYSVSGNNLYEVSYSTLPGEFNGQLPVAEGMIRSFVLLNSNNNNNNNNIG